MRGISAGRYETELNGFEHVYKQCCRRDNNGEQIKKTLTESHDYAFAYTSYNVRGNDTYCRRRPHSMHVNVHGTENTIGDTHFSEWTPRQGNIYRDVDIVVDQDERRVNARRFRFGDGHCNGRLKRMKIQMFQKNCKSPTGLSSDENKQ